MVRKRNVPARPQETGYTKSLLQELYVYWDARGEATLWMVRAFYASTRNMVTLTTGASTALFDLEPPSPSKKGAA